CPEAISTINPEGTHSMKTARPMAPLLLALGLTVPTRARSSRFSAIASSCCPKGVPGPITLYDVGGIGVAYHLLLPEHHEVLVPLLEEVPSAIPYWLEQSQAAPDTPPERGGTRGPVCQGCRRPTRDSHPCRDPLHLCAPGSQDLFGGRCAACCGTS